MAKVECTYKALVIANNNAAVIRLQLNAAVRSNRFQPGGNWAFWRGCTGDSRDNANVCRIKCQLLDVSRLVINDDKKVFIDTKESKPSESPEEASAPGMVLKS